MDPLNDSLLDRYSEFEKLKQSFEPNQSRLYLIKEKGREGILKVVGEEEFKKASFTNKKLANIFDRFRWYHFDRSEKTQVIFDGYKAMLTHYKKSYEAKNWFSKTISWILGQPQAADEELKRIENAENNMKEERKVINELKDKSLKMAVLDIIWDTDIYWDYLTPYQQILLNKGNRLDKPNLLNTSVDGLLDICKIVKEGYLKYLNQRYAEGKETSPQILKYLNEYIELSERAQNLRIFRFKEPVHNLSKPL